MATNIADETLLVELLVDSPALSVERPIAYEVGISVLLTSMFSCVKSFLYSAYDELVTIIISHHEVFQYRTSYYIGSDGASVGARGVPREAAQSGGASFEP